MQVFGIKITVTLIIALVLGIYMIVSGITYISKGKISDKTEQTFSKKYTSESIVNYSKWNGVVTIIMGIGLILTFVLSSKENPHPLIPNPYNMYTMLIIIVLAILSFILFRIFVLKKKTTVIEGKVVNDKIEDISEEDMQE